MTKEKTKIKDIFDGEIIYVWEDGDLVTLAIGLVTIAMPKEEWEIFKKDINKLNDL